MIIFVYKICKYNKISTVVDSNVMRKPTITKISVNNADFFCKKILNYYIGNKFIYVILC